VQVTHIRRHSDRKRHPGHRERLRHVERTRRGARCYLVMCEAKDPISRPRKIKAFNDKAVFVGGKIVEREGDWWVELRDLVPIEDVAPELPGKPPAFEQEFFEGAEKLRLHRHKERNRMAVARKKEEALKRTASWSAKRAISISHRSTANWERGSWSAIIGGRWPA